MKNHIEYARKLSNSQLHHLMKEKTSSEREILAEIISYICEVDRRTLYLDYNCANLFDYLKKEMKYSNGAAQRRIDSARLMQVAPEMKQKLETGELTLAQVTVVATAVKQLKRETGEICSKEVRRELINKVISMPVEKAQQVVAQRLNLEVKAFDKKVVQRDESVRLEITLSKDEAELLAEVKDLLSHTNAGASTKEILVIALRELKKRKDPSLKGLRRARTSTVEVNPQPEVAPRLAKTASAPSAASRAQIFKKDKCCQWKFESGRLCGSTFQLQLDHKKSRWKGGDNEESNLQLLCAVHNKLKFKQEVGLR